MSITETPFDTFASGAPVETRKATRAMRSGFFAIGIYDPKHEGNIGTLWRSSAILGAQMTFQIGGRFRRQCSDTISAWKHVPHIVYPDFAAFLAARPHDAPLVGVELDARACPIGQYRHPERAVYMLGAEDYGLPKAALEAADQLVQLPGRFCLNVSVAGSIVMYDRITKAAKS